MILSKKLFQEPYSNQDYERDVEAISNTENNMGMYNAKSYNAYKITEDNPTNSNRKLEQIILVEDALFSMKWNACIAKIDLLQNVKTEELWEPSQCPGEFPETSIGSFTGMNRLFYWKSLEDFNNGFLQVQVSVP